MPHTYTVDAALLVIQCLQALQELIEIDERGRFSHSSLYDMKEVLATTEEFMLTHIHQVLEEERRNLSSSIVHNLDSFPPDLISSVALLKSMMHDKRSRYTRLKTQQFHTDSETHCYYPARSTSDSLLFRLIVDLQLCMVRIDDARIVIAGRRLHRSAGLNSSTISMKIGSVVGFAAMVTFALRGHQGERERELHAFYRPAAAWAVGLLLVGTMHNAWRHAWMSAKIVKSTNAIDYWNQQWHSVQFQGYRQQIVNPNEYSKNAVPMDADQDANLDECNDSIKSHRLVGYALHQSPKSSLWHTQGELRFLMLKRVMDVFYASVDTAVDYSGSDPKASEANWQLALMTAGVASFYSLIGASERAAEATSTSESARRLIQSAWGMVSLPAIKSLSLQASRLLKGAAVADRVEIAGVSCFVLSLEPAPELAAAIKRFHNSFQHRKPIQCLSTIDEKEEHTPRPYRSCKKFARSCTRYRQRDVVFHLTGGGFFAHIIASDLPYLLDWSGATGAVVICPEYDLLPEHTFPDALYQVCGVYSALLSGEAVPSLGFEVNRIVVTGESAGGNLAAAMCVKICNDQDQRHDLCLKETIKETNSQNVVESMPEMSTSFDLYSNFPLRLPDALMLSCPVLNLSLELSHSRIVGNADPVLPSGLISAISEAYLPPSLGIDKKDPLASPSFAPDAILRRFPPTLLFASSNDPVLDDSVIFNQRLRHLGVQSDLRAVQNLPHAYLGLGTAGFPEAQQVQIQCQEWLSIQLAGNDSQESV